MIDLRSDTVTKPSKAMLEAMLNAEVGDDVFHEDPTVKLLEQKLANMFGHEAALFCPSGTMCNQIAIKLHTQPLNEIILDKLSHVYYYETAGYAFNSGCGVRLLDGNNGRITAQQIEENIQPDFDWLPISKLVIVENTCNKGGGAVYSLQSLKEISSLCKQKNLKLHMDGARFFNALQASNTAVEDYRGLFDSVSICLSKGLGAPVGSVLIGNNVFIKKARKVRKALGGGMRQVGILAAAGLYAIENNIDRIEEDHFNAKKIAEALQQQEVITKVVTPETNIVLFDVDTKIGVEQYLKYLKENGILAVPFGKNTIRMVTHLDVSKKDADKVFSVIKNVKL